METFLSQFSLSQLSEFHFLRPWWLLAIIPAIILCVLLWRQKRRSSAWQNIIDTNLLKHLVEGEISTAFRWQLIGLMLAWLITTVALAGPSWQKIPQPVHQPENAVVILLDLSPSMLAEDLKPSRLVRARYKLIDYLQKRKEGVTALIAYAGEAHVVSPLTDDTNTITNLLPALEPAIMPLPGSNIEMATELATQLFNDAGIHRGEILVATDGIDPQAFSTLRELLGGKNFRLSILGVGSTEGAPIPTGNGGFIRDNNRDVVVAKLNRNELGNLSTELGGIYTDLRPDETDVNTLIAAELRPNLDEEQRLIEREFDIWRDQGPWLALLLLPFIALSFRKGWVLSLIFLVGLQPEKSYAFDWQDLWLRKDQQGQISMEQGDPKTAAQQFRSPDWRGTANYRAEDFEAAATDFAQGDSAVDNFNRGNALAKAGKLEDALSAYESAMKKQDDFEDAQFNYDLVKQLLEQQKQQQSDSGESQDQNDGQQDNQQANNSDQQQQNQGDSQNQDGQKQDQQAQNGQQQSGNTDVNEESSQQLADREQQAQQLNDAERQQMQQGDQQNPEDNDEQQDEQGQQQLLAERNQRDSEEQQALEQWLRRVPDDPSGLMRRKFEYQHRKLLQEYRNGKWQPPENQANERW